MRNFSKTNDYGLWHDPLHARGAYYAETAINGYLIGYMVSVDDKVIALWYNKEGMGTVNLDSKVDDPVAYSEQDPNWPYN